MKRNPLKLITPSSALFVLGADLTAAAFEAGATIVLPIIGNITVQTFFGAFTFVIVFLNEFITTKKLAKAFVNGLIFGALVWIPTPIAGVIASVSQLIE